MRYVTFLALVLLASCVPPDAIEGPPDEGGDLEEPGADDDAAPGNAATIVASAFPAELLCGATSEVSVEVLNSGTTTWTREASYKLGTVDDEDPFHAAPREWLPDDAVVLPNSSWVFEFEILAPGTEGTFITDWRMLQEAVEWFGQSVSHEVVVSCPEDAPEDWEYTSAVEDSIFTSASWVRDNFPQYFDLEAIDATVKRTLAYEMMTTVINDLRGNGVLASRCIANPGLPPSDPFYWCSDALVVGPDGIGVTVDIYFSWSYPADPQTAVTGTGSTGVVTSDLVPVP